MTLHLVVVLVFSAWNYRVHSKARFDDFAELTLFEMAASQSTPKKEVTLPVNRANDRETVKVKEKPTPRSEKPASHASDVGAKNRVNVEAQDFPFAFYLRLMRNRIQEYWEPPYQAGETGKMNAIVSFKVQRNGRVTDIVVKNSSGKYLFDAAAQRALLAAKLPPLPDEYAMEQLSVTIDFEATWQN